LKVYFAVPSNSPAPLPAFIDTLEKKMRMKLLKQFTQLHIRPLPREPTIKHFTIARYNKLYELRARIKVMVRIVFTIQNDGSVLLLVPFVKSHKRDTMQALDASLQLLAQINNGTCSVQEMSINQIQEETV
jgi:mRNA-degrading endonuclease RelE of RelBE toxin-antitoxin system